ncbi:HIRAN domain-containing protein [Shewanella sp.]|uniref:HIRAN domain-containing protein n=1 Tax=Shewanella sp. TaxID=50422 RepID=UPI0025FBB96D|nr:HIRAN domain-containing protein [Shewanella sp.]
MMINNVVEPSCLLLAWQPRNGGSRYLVAQICKLPSSGYSFKYLLDSDDFKKAKSKGFEGYPAFKLTNETYTQNVLEPFIRRLPPKSRRDFKNYLAQNLLTFPFNGSDFTLLAYTGAKSPGDGFSLVPDFTGVEDNIEFQLEVVGTRYENNLDLEMVRIGDKVELDFEPSNTYDPCAIAILHTGGRLGYVNKMLCDFIGNKLKVGNLSAVVSRKNGTADRPLIYLLLSVK